LERLKLIEFLKKENLTLQQIRERLEWYDTAACDEENREKQLFDEMERLQKQFQKLEEEILRLKPVIAQLDQRQQAYINRMIAGKSFSLLQAISLLLGENPFIL
jgi:DNA-binding transcriptional MerR regulator